MHACINCVCQLDVVAVRFARVQGGIYSIQCVYLHINNASGCVYVLVGGEEGVENAVGTIQPGGTGREFVHLPNAGCYGEVLAYDLEGGATGEPSARTNITIDESCRVDSGRMTHTEILKLGLNVDRVPYLLNQTT